MSCAAERVPQIGMALGRDSEQVASGRDEAQRDQRVDGEAVEALEVTDAATEDGAENAHAVACPEGEVDVGGVGCVVGFADESASVDDGGVGGEIDDCTGKGTGVNDDVVGADCPGCLVAVATALDEELDVI